MVPNLRRVPTRLLLFVVLMFILGGPRDAAAAGADGLQGELPAVGDANGYEIVINLPAFRLYLYQHGVLVKEYPIGIGTVVSPSRLGRTEIVNKVAHPTYYPPDWYTRGLSPIPPGPSNPVGTRWLGLGWSGYGIHGTNAPHTIGTAASAGCIRMLNEHVEELADYVSIGTPVTFLYETIVAWRDPVTRRPYIVVYPDLYGLNTNTVERAKEVLLAQGVDVDDLDEWALAAILQEADGAPHPVPRRLSVQLDGERIEGAALRSGSLILVSLSHLASALREELPWGTSHDGVHVHGRVVPGGVVIGGLPYAPPEAAAEALGLSHSSYAGSDPDVVAVYRTVIVRRNGVTLPERGFVEGELLWLPVSTLAVQLGVAWEWNAELDALVLGGRPVFGARRILGSVYLPYDRLARLLPVEVAWVPGSAVAAVLPREPVATGVSPADAFSR